MDPGVRIHQYLVKCPPLSILVCVQVDDGHRTAIDAIRYKEDVKARVFRIAVQTDALNVCVAVCLDVYAEMPYHGRDSPVIGSMLPAATADAPAPKGLAPKASAAVIRPPRGSPSRSFCTGPRPAPIPRLPLEL